MINLAEQGAYFYRGNKMVGMSVMSTGREGYNTPSGEFSVIEKDATHVSSIYGDYVDRSGQVLMENVEMMGLASTSLAADFTDWVAKGYRWSVVSGPYAYIMKENAKNEGSRFARKSANETIGRAYYMRPGKVVLVVETDAASGLSKIRMGGIESDHWTPTKNLSTRPVRNALGEIETPDMASILPILEATPSPGSSAKPAASARPSPTAAPSK